jgi:hypothetical protein
MFSLFKSGKMSSTKYGWLNLLPFGKVSGTMSLRPVKKSVIIIFVLPMACRILRMISVGDRATIFEEGWEHWNQDSSPIAIHSKWFSSDSCRIHDISVDASTRAALWAGDRHGTPSAARIFFNPSSL